MSESSLRIVFFGTPEYAACSLRSLLESRHQVVAAVTRQDSARGRGKKLQPCEVKALALEHGIPVLDPKFPRGEGFLRVLAELKPDLGVVIAYGRILPDDVLELPRLGCINAHASLLPRLRGAAPIERAILTGEATTGVCIMQVATEMDAGDVLMTETVPITDETEGGSLRETLADLSARMLVEAADRLGEGPLHAEPQDHSAATFAPPLKKEETRIDWTRPAEGIDRQVRAFAPKPGAFTMDGGKRLKILQGGLAQADTAGSETSEPIRPGTVVHHGADGITLQTGSGFYHATRVQPEGKGPMNAADYARGRIAAMAAMAAKAGSQKSEDSDAPTWWQLGPTGSDTP